jgi:signal transduction histidine kinase
MSAGADVTPTALADDAREKRNARWISNAIAGVSAVLIAASVLMSLINEPITRQDETDPLFNVLILVGFAIYVSIGCLIVRRQPRNTIGWLLLAVPLIGSLTVANGGYTDRALVTHPGSLPFGLIGAWLDRWLFVLAMAAFIPIFLLFPDGRLPSRSQTWRVIGIVTFAAPILTVLAFALTPGRLTGALTHLDRIHVTNPLGIAGATGLLEALTQAGGFLMLVTGILAFVGLVIRYRRAGDDVRQQIRWLALVGATFLGGIAVGIFLTIVVTDVMDGPAGTVLFVFEFTTLVVGIPLACGIAVLRYRLYDLDVVIRKAVVFAVLAAFIALVYAAIVGGIGALVGSRSNATLAFVAAAVLAIAFQPARDAAHRFADRVVYGKRATPYEVLAEFSTRMGATYATDDVLPRMAQTLGEGTGARAATVWLRVGDELRPAASWPRERDLSPVRATGGSLPDLGEPAVEVRDRGDVLGALSVDMPPADPMTPAKERLIEDLAAQAGLVLRNVGLIEELRASRQRLVAAQDEERRKLERNLHDGAQQQLVALKVQLRLAEQLTERDPAKGVELLTRLQGAAAEALDDLRDLARGIYPPLLADQGLVAAIEGQTRRASLPVEVRSEGIGRYARDVESAVYFCVLEALNNIAKYADATRAVVRLREAGDQVLVEVEDDGRGFDATVTSYGTGLQGMADRLDAIGGTLELTSSVGRGTTVAGRVRLEAPSEAT